MKHLLKCASTFAMASVLACGGSGGGADAGPPPCDQTCQDGVAVLGLRLLLKDIYNFKLQGGPEGPQNQTTVCPLGGTATVTGTATSNAALGTTTVNLTYELTSCAFSETDMDPTQTFQLTFDGTVSEEGIIASQPSSTTSLRFDSPPIDGGTPTDGGTGISVDGTVYTPPVSYGAMECPLTLVQTGNEISGKLCGRNAGTSL
jgi:hypothetical protein